MNRFTHWLERFLKRFGRQGIVPSGTMPPDNTERFDAKRQPEQYAEFNDLRRPNKME